MTKCSLEGRSGGLTMILALVVTGWMPVVVAQAQEKAATKRVKVTLSAPVDVAKGLRDATLEFRKEGCDCEKKCPQFYPKCPCCVAQMSLNEGTGPKVSAGGRVKVSGHVDIAVGAYSVWMVTNGGAIALQTGDGMDTVTVEEGTREVTLRQKK